MPEISKVSRQFGLIHALLSKRYGLTIDEIFRSVEGYREDYDPYDKKKLSSLERKFERDKTDISSLGIRIQVNSPADSPGDNHGMRYRIDPDTYVFPKDVTFSRRDIALLQLAARAWQEGSLADHIRRATDKLRSFGIEPDDALSGLRPRITGYSGLAEEFMPMIDSRAVATFSYLKAGEKDAMVRTVAPLAIAEWNSRWYLLGWDFDREAERTFLLSRVTTRPQVVSDRSFQPEHTDYGARLIEGLDALAAQNEAVVRCVPNSDAHFRLGAFYGPSRDGDTFRIPFADADILADELMEYGLDIEIIEPESVRRLLRKRFERLASAHQAVS